MHGYLHYSVMISFLTGDIFQSNAQAIVNPVNTVGVMGKGLALAFKKKFPSNYLEYKQAYERDELKTGKMLVHLTGQLITQIIINFPTKKHWRDPSKLVYIETGLDDLVTVINDHKIKSIAIPALGCGLGGLQWESVRSEIEDKLRHLSINTEILIYGPGFS